MFEHLSSTYTYLLGCGRTRDAIIIDAVMETVERDANVCLLNYKFYRIPIYATVIILFADNQRNRRQSDVCGRYTRARRSCNG